MTNCHYGLTIGISRFLHHLLWPIYNQVTGSKTFVTGGDVISAMKQYTNNGLLRPNTLFATVQIDDLYSMFPHEQTIEALQDFLQKYKSHENVQGLTIPTITKLALIFLHNQYFLYENRIYRQVRGGAFKSPLTTLLANIYLFYWQQDLVSTLNDKSEIFGR